MAIKQLIVSDMGGAELDDGQAAKVTVSGHPALDNRGPVELDIGIDEAEQLQDSDLNLVQLTVNVPGGPRRQVMMEVDAFEKLFDSKVDVGDLLRSARRQTIEPPTRARRRQAAAASSQGRKVDYSSPEWAGVLHRGVCTDAEKEFVRANLDKANENRAREGQALIDPSDPKEKQRYGL